MRFSAVYGLAQKQRHIRQKDSIYKSVLIKAESIRLLYGWISRVDLRIYG